MLYKAYRPRDAVYLIIDELMQGACSIDMVLLFRMSTIIWISFNELDN